MIGVNHYEESIFFGARALTNGVVAPLGAETSGTVMRWAGPPLRSDGGCWANAPGAVTARAAARLARTMLRLADMYDLNLPALC